MRRCKCKICGKGYEVAGWDKRNRRTCGDYECKIEDTKRRAKARYEAFKTEFPERFGIEYDIKCEICGNTFKAKRNDAKYCTDRCRKAGDAKHSKKYYTSKKKRPEIPIQCLHCKEIFKTTRKNQLFCLKSECREKAGSYYSNRCMKRNREKMRIQARARGAVRRDLEKQPCVVCGNMNHIHAHHHNYDKKTDVTWLCALHHKQLHSWDSN